MKKIKNQKQVNRPSEMIQAAPVKKTKEEPERLEETLVLGLNFSEIPFATYENIRNRMIGIR